MKPDEVEPEWAKARALLGGPAETRRFIERALKRLRAPIEPVGRAFKAPLSFLVPVTLRERLREEGIEGTVRIQFGDPPGAGRLHLSRAHPLVGLVAEALVETALDNAADPTDPATLPRCGGDRHVLWLIKLWLKAPVEERNGDGKRRMSGGKSSKRGRLRVESSVRCSPWFT